jgi:hypothetical protein
VNNVTSDDEISAITSDPSSSHWLRDALASALKRDPVDAAHDAARLSAVLEHRASDVLAASQVALASMRLLNRNGPDAIDGYLSASRRPEARY